MEIWDWVLYSMPLQEKKQWKEEKSRGWKAELIETYIGEGGELDIQIQNELDVPNYSVGKFLEKNFVGRFLHT